MSNLPQQNGSQQQQQQQQQPNAGEQKNPDDSAELYAFLAEEKKGEIPQSMMKPGSRRAVLSPYGRDPLIFAAFDAMDDISRLRSQTIAHEHGRVTEERAKRASMQTDALFGIREHAAATETPVVKANPAQQSQLTVEVPASSIQSPPTAAEPQPAEVSTPVTPLKAASPVVAATAASAAAVAEVSTPTTAAAPAALEPAVQSDGCIMDDDGKLRFATLDALLDRLTMLRFADSTFNKDFITTYNLFTTSDKLLDMLTERYNRNPPDGLSPEGVEAFWKDLASSRLRIMIFLTDWVRMLWNSTTPDALVSKLNAFLEEASKTQKGACDKLWRIMKKALTDDESKGPFMFNTKLPLPILPLNMVLGAPPPTVSVLTIHPKEIARQMSLIEHDMFRAVKPWELQNLAFSKKDKSLAPNINNITRHFNEVSQWFACEILKHKDLDERVRVVELVLDTADYCRQLQNYNALNEIISAMNTSAVFRLKKTWAALSQKYTTLFKELSDLMSNKRNYQNLRHQLHDVQPPFVPYLGVYLTDLTFIEEGNPTMHDELINWHKCRLQAKIIIEVQTYQQTPYALRSVPWIRDFFSNIHAPFTADEQWKLSLEIEPRTATTTTTTTATTTATTASSAASTPAKPANEGAAASAAATSTVSLPVAVPTAASAAAVEPSSAGSSFGSSPGVVPALPQSEGTAELDLNDSIPVSPLPPGSAVSPALPQEDGNVVVEVTDPSAGAEPAPDYLESTLLTMRVFAPGSPQRLTLTVPYSTRVSDMFSRIVTEAKNEGLEISDQSPAKQYVLISPGSRSAPQGLQFQPMMSMGDAVNSSKGQNSFALFRELALNGVILFEGQDSFQVLTYVDADSMLYTNAVIIDEIFRRCGEFSFMMLDGKKQLFWLNYNSTLAEQGFDQNTCFLIMFPLQRFTSHSGSEERERVRSGRSMQNIVPSPDNKIGFLAVMSARQVSRPGIIVRFQSQQQANQSMAGVGSPSSLNSRSFLSLSSRGSVSDKERKRFIAVDNFLMCFSDEHSAFPQSVWALDQCDISLGTLASGNLCIIIRRHSLSPFKKSKMTVIAAAGDSLTRQWCEALQKKSRYNDSKRVFSKSLTELARRPGATSFVPQFVRDGLDHLFRTALDNPTLFTASISAQSVDRVRDAINHGKMPSFTDRSDDTALAQTILSFYAEMPVSLIPGSLFSELWSYYVDALKARAPVVERLQEILSKLPIPNQVNLKYLLWFFAVWAEHSKTKVVLPELLGAYLIHLRGEDVPVSFKGQTSELILKIFEDLLASMEQLTFPSDADFDRFMVNFDVENDNSPILHIPVTALDKDDVTQLMTSVENSHLVLDLNDIAPSTTPPPSHKHTPSSYSDGDVEIRATTSSGSSSLRQSQDFEDDGEKESTGEGTETPRKEKHSSTRVRASHFFNKFRKSFSTKKKPHGSAGSTPTSSVMYGAQLSSPDDDSASSEGCSTPTGSSTPSGPPVNDPQNGPTGQQPPPLPHDPANNDSQTPRK